MTHLSSSLLLFLIVGLAFGVFILVLAFSVLIGRKKEFQKGCSLASAGHTCQCHPDPQAHTAKGCCGHAHKSQK